MSSSNNNNNKATKRNLVSNENQPEVGAEEDEESVISVTSQLTMKPIENCKNLNKEVILRRIRHRKRMNKVRAAVGGIFRGSSKDSGDGGEGTVQHKRWVDDAFAAL
ncbi:unnamed protein product [Vicia faba]|uniref:Uncharacterized protein n=1 Tax=Vicia faba TaxID=3906 RepID=A0AAV0ZU28_VICFA|nr:unnamed protein product [Vicia faba]